MTVLDEPAPVVDNDPPSLEGLYQDHHKAVFHAAYRVSGSVQDAEDVLQSVFLKLLKRTERQEFARNPASYLCRAAINASLDQLRAKRRNPVSDIHSMNEGQVEECMATSPNTAEVEIKRKQIQHQLRLALAELNPRAAEMFALRYFEDVSNDDISDIFDTSSSVVAVTLHRTRSRLQELLSEFAGEGL